ncbi:MAG: hypothetical protein ACYCVH_15870 [Ignavibacteriaceae bacterium]
MKLKIEPETNSIFSSSASMIFHLVILLAIILILNEISDKPRISSRYIQVASQGITQENPATSKEKTETEKQKSLDEKKYSGDEFKSPKSEKAPAKNVQTSYNFSNLPVDTTGLDQVYHESTLNVTLKYPNGWTYIDQDVKNKLDGITFWFAQTNILPPPYVHLEVEDKDLFDPARFKNKTEINGYKIYFNDPEELEGQISQTLYIRTDSDEDYSIKLIIKGKSSFDSFQPIFFGMVKSFKFGENLF